MIRCVTYPGGLHGEFIITQIQKRHRRYFTNYYCPDIPAHNRYKVYDNVDNDYPALTAHWNMDDVKKLLEENKYIAKKDLILKRHKHLDHPFPNINIYPDNSFYFKRLHLLGTLKIWLTEGLKWDIVGEESFNEKNNEQFDENDLGISEFFDFSGLYKLEKFFQIKYTHEMRKQIMEYYQRDDDLLNNYFGDWKIKSVSELRKDIESL